MTWYAATANVATLTSADCDLNDGSTAGNWRLPTETEWQAVADAGLFRLVDAEDEAGCYWSSSPGSPPDQDAVNVDVDD